jgi:GYF domain 2
MLDALVNAGALFRPGPSPPERLEIEARMATEWHYTRAGSQTGPISTDEVRRLLAADGFPADALVWREGLANWQRPGDFPEFALRKPPPPPPHRPPLAPPQGSSQTKRVIKAALAGLGVSIAFTGASVISEGRLDPIDPYQIFNPGIIGYWVGRVGFIPLIFVIVAIASSFRRAPLWTSALNLLGAVVGISIIVALGVATVAAIQPVKEFPFAAAGPDRESFIKTGVQSCIRKQRGLPENQGVSEKAIADFCGCYVELTANKLSNDEVKYQAEHPGQFSPSAIAKMTASHEQCRARVR